MVASEMTGWIPYYLPRKIYIQIIVMGILTYAVVAVLEYQKIRKVPMDEALKNVE
jgi:putative ABC transport system permease protein